MSCIACGQFGVHLSWCPGFPPDTEAPPPDDPTRPSHYRITVKGVEMDVGDVGEALGLPPWLFNALKYIARAGKKGDALVDLRKAKTCIEREIARLESKNATKERP